MKSRIKERGSALHIVIIVILVVAVLGLLGFVFWQNFASKLFSESTDNETSQTTETENSTLPESYTSSFGKFTVRYPSDWVVDVDTSSDMYEYSSLTSPSGTKLNIGADLGGRGGSCEAQDSEVPFQAGNSCSSSVYLSVERLSIDNVHYRTNVPNNYDTEKVNVYLVTKKYATSDGEITYTIGATSDSPYHSVEENEPIMGYLFPDLSIVHYDEFGDDYPYISIYASGDTEEFLTSVDAQTIKEIIRSLEIGE